MTCIDFKNAIKSINCSEKHPVSRANHGNTKQAVVDRWPTIDTLSANNCLQICYSTIFSA